MSAIPFSLGNVNASQTEKLNRLQKAFAGQASGNIGKLTPEILKMLKNKMESNGINVASIMPGRIQEHPDDIVKIAEEIAAAGVCRRNGVMHLRWEETQDAIAAKHPAVANDARSINFCEPRIMISDAELPFLTNVVVVADPDDASRLAKSHIKKQPNFTPVFFQSLIATNDNAHWKKQREHLNEVFLPKLSLSKIFPVSSARAKKCADRLGSLSRSAGKYGVQMHEFYLHEAQAQLQLALFGLDEEFMERTNKPIRDVFAGINPNMNYGKDVCLQMIEKVGQNPSYASATDPEVIDGSKKIHGPLSKSVFKASQELGLNLQDQFGNMMLILFAGHDTTAHTMTWLTYEMAKNPQFQKKLHEECDAFFARLNGRPMEYEDCEHLPYLTRCVMETLRFWTAVPAGTHRQLQFDDYVKGPDGTEVLLPKGTYVQIQNWTRHRNPKLWGEDAHVFNPERDFRDDEIWGGESFKGFNPSSDRFSPFTFAPRDCLGKNFAQMEMRAILVNVFHKYHFELSEPYKNFDAKKAGYGVENFQATMGPRDLTPEGLEATKRRADKNQTPQMAMYLKVTARKPSSRL